MASKTNCTINGVDYFRVYATVGKYNNGRLKQKDFYGKSKKEAEKKRDEYLDSLKGGLTQDFKTVSFGKLFHVWLFDIVRVSDKIKPSTFEKYEGIYRNYIKESPFYHTKLHELRSVNIQQYYNSLLDKGKTSNTIKMVNKLIKTFFYYAVDHDYILKNPCSGKRIVIPDDSNYDFFDENEENVIVFTDDEVVKIKTELDRSVRSSRIRFLYLLALGTGLRAGELLALKCTDINKDSVKVTKTLARVKVFDNKEKGTSAIVIMPPKTKSSVRKVPLPRELEKELDKHLLIQKKDKLKSGIDTFNEGNFLFITDTGKHLDPKNFRRAYDRLLIRADVEHKKFHALRHTYATNLFDAGATLKTVQELLGHSKASTTADIYLHTSEENKIEAAQMLNRLFK